jgi:hypothetical protein
VLSEAGASSCTRLPWQSRLGSSVPSGPAVARATTRRRSSCARPGSGAHLSRGDWSLVGLLSWGSSQRCPSIDIQHARPVPAHGRPRLTGCPADRTCGPWSSRSWVRRDFVASLRPRLATPGLLPSMPFLTTTTACSAHAVQVCCTLQPIMGFAWLQARSAYRAGPASGSGRADGPISIAGVTETGRTNTGVLAELASCR